LGAFFGGGMLFVTVRNRRKNNLQPHVFPALVLVWIFAGLSFGIVSQFHFSQAFRWPLILVTLGAVGALVAVALYIRMKRLGAPPTQPLV
jgi:peptidoglycan/LPS O-acetylase OafA/YrhL